MIKALLSAYLIPILNAGSWLLGGLLITQLPPYELSTLRTAIVALLLFVYSSFAYKDLVRELQSKTASWWKHQIFLSITGRVIYYYFSAKALQTISPFEAILMTTLLPIVTMIIESSMGYAKVSITTFSFSMATCALCLLCLLTSASGNQTTGIRLGHIEMVIAIISFAAHSIYYKKNISDISPTIPLLVQFLVAAVLLLPFINFELLQAINSFDYISSGRFFVYAVVCGLLPFICLHYALGKFSSFIVMNISILGPIMAFLMRGLYQSEPLNNSFIFLTVGTVFMSFLALWSNQKFIKFWRKS